MEIIISENGKSLGNYFEKIVREHEGNIDLITMVRPKDRNLLKYFDKINKKITCNCPVEFFIYPSTEVYSKSLCNVIPFDTNAETVIKTAYKIEDLLKKFDAKYNKVGKTKFRYKMILKF